jgi:transcriptional regulator with XRE-family HTH domain
MSKRTFNKTLNSIGSNIEQLRREANLSVRELAKDSGVGLATLSDIKNSKASDLKLSTLFKLAECLNVNLEFLLMESDFKTNSKELEEFESAIKILNRILMKQKK